MEVRNERIRTHVEEQAARGAQWPAPWLALNPAFASGSYTDELVRDGVLHPEREQIFQVGKSAESGTPAAVVAPPSAQRDRGDPNRRLLRTDDRHGFRKSLAYIVPIVGRVLREGSGRGVKAIVVYPMNALANSQREELGKFLTYGSGEGNERVTFARYTGQEDEETRRRILDNPPDILLTTT